MKSVRVLSKHDLPSLLAIENSVHVAPWTKETFQVCFEAGYQGWVVEVEKKMFGFVILSIRKEECHILNLCIAREYQHQGHGAALLKHALAQAKNLGAGLVYLEVRRSNAHAIGLYRKLHFQLIGERKNYYPSIEGMEDALIFAKSLYQAS